MQPRAAFFFSLLLLATLPAARAVDDPVTVTAAVQPKRIVLSDLKLNKAAEITVTYVLTNHTADTQVINRFCTLRPTISGDDGRLIPLNMMGSDGAALIGAPDILILAPGKQETILFRVAFVDTGKRIIIERNDESGMYWGGGWISTPKFLDISAIYVDQLTSVQIEKLRPELKGTKYSRLDFKLPSVRVEIAK